MVRGQKYCPNFLHFLRFLAAWKNKNFNKNNYMSYMALILLYFLWDLLLSRYLARSWPLLDWRDHHDQAHPANDPDRRPLAGALPGNPVQAYVDMRAYALFGVPGAVILAALQRARCSCGVTEKKRSNG